MQLLKRTSLASYLPETGNPMHSRIVMAIAFLATMTAALLLMTSSAEAASVPETPAEYFDNIMRVFQRTCEGWQSQMMTAAIAIFWPLALISLTWKMMQTWAMGTDIKGLFQELFWPGFFIAFWYFLLTNGTVIAGAILDSFIQLGESTTGAARGTYVSPAAVMNVGWLMFTELWDTLSSAFSVTSPWTWLTCFILMMVMLGTLFVIASIAIDLLVAIVGCWVSLYGGIIILGLGGAFGFGLSDKAKNYFMTMIANGVRLMGMGLLIGVFVNVISEQYMVVQQVASQNSGIPAQHALILLLIAFAFKIACSQIPELLVGMINGHVGQLGARGEGIVGGVIAGTMTAASIGMAGVGMAASAAKSAGGAVMGGIARHNLAKAQNALSIKSLTGMSPQQRAAARAGGMRGVAADANLTPPKSLSDSISAQKQTADSDYNAVKPSGGNPMGGTMGKSMGSGNSVGGSMGNFAKAAATVAGGAAAGAMGAMGGVNPAQAAAAMASGSGAVGTMAQAAAGAVAGGIAKAMGGSMGSNPSTGSTSAGSKADQAFANFAAKGPTIPGQAPSQSESASPSMGGMDAADMGERADNPSSNGASGENGAWEQNGVSSDDLGTTDSAATPVSRLSHFGQMSANTMKAAIEKVFPNYSKMSVEQLTKATGDLKSKIQKLEKQQVKNHASFRSYGNKAFTGVVNLSRITGRMFAGRHY